MSIRVHLDIDPYQAILLKRGLNAGGDVQLFFANEVARHCDPYIPKDNGPLKNTKTITPERVTYGQPYAQKQYYENKGKGLRGKEWDKRMMADHGNEIAEAVAKKAGGKCG